MSLERKLPQNCPSCESRMKVKKLVCPQCSTEVDGMFSFPLLTALSGEDQLFIVEFVRASGSLKEMSSMMKLSYPTIRNQLDDIIARINTLQKQNK